MAVVQISRIQIRRGKINSGTGLPQLASGELAWAVDSQELYIGNGSVSEGSPAVGNTKILTLNDLTSQGNILNLTTYIYKPNDITIITGSDANNPTIRALQDRLDEAVSVLSFGATGNGVTDDTVAIQRAIDQLYLNFATKASDNTDQGITTRKVLVFPAGVYKITDTVYIPSYATLIGPGLDKCVIRYVPSGTANDPAIQFINDTSVPLVYANINSTDALNQPRGIYINGLTIETTSGQNTCMQLDCVKDSYFENMSFNGNWSGALVATSIGIVMNVKSSLVTCEGNIFKNIKFNEFSYAVFANGDTRANQFKYCDIDTCYQGFVLGLTADGTTIGRQYGPRDTSIEDTTFNNVKRHAVYIGLGSKNSTKDNTYTNVGNDGGGNTVAAYPQVYFATTGNSSKNDISDRPNDLATSNPLSVYVPEVAGHGIYVPNFYNQIDLGYQIQDQLAFRLPIATDQNALPNGTIVYNIDYFYKSRTHPLSRRGTITISADVDNGNIQLSDEFDIACDNTVSETDQLRLDFKAKFMDQNNVEYVGAVGQTIATISVYYINDYSADGGTFNYSYSASF